MKTTNPGGRDAIPPLQRTQSLDWPMCRQHPTERRGSLLHVWRAMMMLGVLILAPAALAQDSNEDHPSTLDIPRTAPTTAPPVRILLPPRRVPNESLESQLPYGTVRVEIYRSTRVGEPPITLKVILEPNSSPANSGGVNGALGDLARALDCVDLSGSASLPDWCANLYSLTVLDSAGRSLHTFVLADKSGTISINPGDPALAAFGEHVGRIELEVSDPHGSRSSAVWRISPADGVADLVATDSIPGWEMFHARPLRTHYSTPSGGMQSETSRDGISSWTTEIWTDLYDAVNESLGFPGWSGIYSGFGLSPHGALSYLMENSPALRNYYAGASGRAWGTTYTIDVPERMRSLLRGAALSLGSLSLLQLASPESAEDLATVGSEVLLQLTPVPSWYELYTGVSWIDQSELGRLETCSAVVGAVGSRPLAAVTKWGLRCAGQLLNFAGRVGSRAAPLLDDATRFASKVVKTSFAWAKPHLDSAWDGMKAAGAWAADSAKTAGAWASVTASKAWRAVEGTWNRASESLGFGKAPSDQPHLPRVPTARTLPKEPFRETVHDRHYASKVRHNSDIQDVNTMVLSGVDVAADIQAINGGLALRTDNDWLINGRIYRQENGTLFPVKGNGLVPLNRGAYKALRIFSKCENLDDYKRAWERLSKEGISTEEGRLALWTRYKS